MPGAKHLHEKKVLTTGEVARICHVAPRTVSKWFDTGKLRGYRIPGSRDRRIPVQQLEAFMRAHGIPLEGPSGGSCRVLIVGDTPDGLAEALDKAGRYELLSAANGFEAGIVAQQFRPHVIVLDVDDSRQKAVEICRNVRASADLQTTCVIAAGSFNDTGGRRSVQDGFDDYLPKPYSPSELVRAVEKATDLLS